MYQLPIFTYDSNGNPLDEYDRMSAEEFLAPHLMRFAFERDRQIREIWPKVSRPRNDDEPPWDDL